MVYSSSAAYCRQSSVAGVLCTTFSATAVCGANVKTNKTLKHIRMVIYHFFANTTIAQQQM